MLFSIVICTRRRPELLRLCLESISAQIFDKNLFNVIVVENDDMANVEVQKVVKEFESKFQLEHFLERNIGLSSARNTGIKLSDAKYICYIDDDAKLNENYCVTLYGIIEKYDPDGIGGPYFPFYSTAKPKWYKDDYGSNNKKGYSGYLLITETLTGGNMCFKKDFFNKYGLFDERYGMTGNKLYYGEETLLQLKAREEKPDLKIYYDQKLYILHLVPEKKMKLIFAIKMNYKLGHSQFDFWTNNIRYQSKIKCTALIARLFLSIVYDYSIRIYYRDKTRYEYWQNYIYEVTARKFGIIGGNIRYLQNKKQNIN